MLRVNEKFSSKPIPAGDGGKYKHVEFDDGGEWLSTYLPGISEEEAAWRAEQTAKHQPDSDEAAAAERVVDQSSRPVEQQDPPHDDKPTSQ